ncbi:DUF3341 domain-containing protein (plasmid) [Novosphingobium sp. BL-8A]|uniref:DUF3341 domain-containing protein n=1 Tax=Novosphingobium sp. BL-8A TaxID=3127639 RepID=UPI0037575D10
MAERNTPYAVLGEFSKTDVLLGAARTLREEGWRIEVFSPFPLEGLAEALDWQETRVPRSFLIWGVIGAVAGFAMQVAATRDFPLDIGGRPLVAVPAFLMITFELMILFAVFGGIAAMFLANRLPRLHHPLFDAQRFGLASDDRFFLAVMVGKGCPSSEEARAALWRLNAGEVTEVGESEVS